MPCEESRRITSAITALVWRIEGDPPKRSLPPRTIDPKAMAQMRAAKRVAAVVKEYIFRGRPSMPSVVEGWGRLLGYSLLLMFER